MFGSRVATALISGLVLAITAGTDALAQDAQSDSDNSFLSRFTIAVPFFTRHYPNDQDFNDYNWGGVLFYELDNHFSLAGGDIINSYRRNTAFAAASVVPWNIDLYGVQIDPGLLLGLDLNGGYKGYSTIDPLLGAGTIKISSTYFEDPSYQFLNRLGLLMTIIPGFGNGTSTAFNLALTVRL